MSQLTVVIPTLNAADSIADLLGDLDGLGANLIVVDGGSHDETLKIAQEASTHLRAYQTFAGRGHQIAVGISNALEAETQKQQQWLLILHADSRLNAKAIKALNYHVKSHPDKAAYFALRFRSESLKARVLEKIANLRSLILGLPYGDQGLLICYEHLAEIGGYPPVPLMEDLMIAKRLGRKNLRCLGSGLTTSADKYERDGWLRRICLHFCCFSLHCLGAQPKTILKIYRL